MSSFPSDIYRTLFGRDDEDAPTVECSSCRTEYDPEDINAGEVKMHQVGGEHVCGECIERCASCNEPLSDDYPVDIFGPDVNVRQWALDGKLGKFHAVCAVDELLASWSGDPKVSAAYLNRFQIGLIVAASFSGETSCH